jgi:hypothetical protein
MRQAALFFLLASTPVFAATPDTCSLTSTDAFINLTLSVQGGQTSFHEGEIIPLQLSFSSPVADTYWVNNASYDRSGRLGVDAYCIEPATRDPLNDYFRDGAFIGGGLFSEQELSAKPHIFTSELNEWSQPGPGHYRLFVVSRRVGRGPANFKPSDSVPVTLRSNAVEFEVVPATDEWSSAQLHDAIAAYQSAAGNSDVDAIMRKGPGVWDQIKHSARVIRFLNTKESAAAMATLFWDAGEQPGGFEMMLGLFSAPCRAEAIAGMHREIGNPAHVITASFVYTLAKLQIESEKYWDPPAYNAAHPEISEEYRRKREQYEHDLTRKAIAATIAALPQKTCLARALTTKSLLNSNNLLEPSAESQLRDQQSHCN